MAELTVLVPLGDRQVEMRRPTDGALVLLARISRSLPKIENAEELTDERRNRLIRNLGLIGDLIESMVVKDDDREWLEGVMIDGSVPVEDIFDVIRASAEKFNGQASPAKKATPAVRRRR